MQLTFNEKNRYIMPPFVKLNKKQKIMRWSRYEKIVFRNKDIISIKWWNVAYYEKKNKWDKYLYTIMVKIEKSLKLSNF